jgi:tyrosyl-tRNA synthetase
MPDEMDELELKVEGGSYSIANLLKDAGLTVSTSEAIRMINQGAVKINGEKVSDPKLEISVSTENVYQVGKRKFAKVKISA